jgi:hypothetical protein
MNIINLKDFRHKQLQRDYNRLSSGVLAPILRLRDGTCYTLDRLSVRGVKFTKEYLEFSASFNGQIRLTRIPINSILNITGHKSEGEYNE